MKIGALPIIMGFILVFFLNFINGVEIRINEVELNPLGSDSGNEWIELYSNEEINLTGWKIVNNDEDIKDLNQSFQNYLIINLERLWLDNENESVKLYNRSLLVHSTLIFSDSSNDNRAWSYCNGTWIFINLSYGYENNCLTSLDNNQNLTNQNNSQNIQNTQNIPDTLSFDMDWKEENIVNGEEFEIELEFFNLKDQDYDIRVWIEFGDNNTVISDRYDEKNNEWKSGRYYINEFVKGPEDKAKEILLKIREEHGNFKGNTKLFFKIRNEKPIEKTIKILGKEEQKEDKENKTEEKNKEEINKIEQENFENLSIPGEVIFLGKRASGEIENKSEGIKTQKNIVFESKSELIKKYAIYGFALLCIMLIFLLAFDKLK